MQFLEKLWIMRENIEIQKKKFFSENILSIEIKKSWALMNKYVYLGLSILKLSKTLMYEFWYDYVKRKYGEKLKLCYIDTDRFYCIH